MNERKQTSVKQLQRVHFSKSKKINTFIQWLNSKRIKTIQTKTPITLVSVVYKNALQRFNERKQHSLKVDSFKIMRNNHKQLIYAKQIKHLATKKEKKTSPFHDQMIHQKILCALNMLNDHCVKETSLNTAEYMHHPVATLCHADWLQFNVTSRLFRFFFFPLKFFINRRFLTLA